MPRKKTHEEFLNEVFDLVGDEYGVIGSYVGNKIKINMKHNNCEHEFKVSPNNFLRGTRCPKCFGKNKKTHEQFIQEVFEQVNDEYTVLSKYCGTYNKVKIRHNTCKHQYEVVAKSFISGTRCAKCIGNKKRTTKIFKQEVFKDVGEEYLVLDEYINAKTKLKMKHNICSYEWNVEPSHFRRGVRCPKCAGNAKITHKQFIYEVYELVKDEYTVLSKYKNALTKLKMRHNTCNYEYQISPDHFKRGHRCPKCRASKGEKAISEWLSDNNIKHKSQYRFDDCRDKYPLPFDFAIFNKDMLVCIIEYDGAQHFESVDFWGGEEKLKLIQLRDKLKNEYCKNINTPLLRIPYWDFDDINEILEREVFKYIHKCNK